MINFCEKVNPFNIYKMTKIKWKCKKCGDIVISDSIEHHKMDWCKCRESACDLEEDCCRLIGDAEIIKDESK